MSDFSISKIFSQAKDYVFGEEVQAQRNLKVRLQDEYATEIHGDTKLRIQDGSNPIQEVSAKDYVGTPGKDSEYNGMGDPSTRLKILLTQHQYRHASNDAKVDDQGMVVEPNGALVVPLARPKVSVEVERSKVREGDKVLEADNGAILVPSGQEHRPNPTPAGNKV